jgi:hypothetical protein
LTKPMPMRKRNFRSAYTKPTLVSYAQSKRHSLGSSRVHSECARHASSLSVRLVWKRCPGHATAATARSTNSRMVLRREDHERLHRRYSGTWQVARCCSADCESAWSQDGQCVRGDPGVFAVVEVAESQELKKLVIGKIEKLKGVGGTSTHIALD